MLVRPTTIVAVVATVVLTFAFFPLGLGLGAFALVIIENLSIPSKPN